MPFEFPTEVDSVDIVPEHFRGLYTAGENGKHTIHADFKGHVSGLVSALDKERKSNKESKTKLTAWSALGESPEAVTARISEMETQITATKEGKANWDKLKADLENGYKKELDGEKAKTTAMRTSLENYLIDSEATKVIAELKGVPVLLLPHIRSQVRVFEENGEFVAKVVDKEGDPRGNGKGGFMTIRELVAEMKASESFGRAFEATNKQGGGTPPNKNGGGGNNGQPKSAVQKIASGLAARSGR